MIQTRLLGNGARIILEPVATTDALSLGLWFLHGSRDESDGEEGFSHFLEHMLFKGTRRRTAFQIAQAIDRVGGYLNAFTEKEVTSFHCILPKEHTGLAVEVLVDMVTDSVIDAEELEREKQVVINEIQSSEDNPEERSHEVFLETLWDRHPLARRITGDSGQVERIQRSRLEEFYRGLYVGGNLVVTAAGAMEPEALFDLLARHLESIPGRSLPLARVPPERTVRSEYRQDRFQQVHLYLGAEIDGAEQLEEYYRAQVFSTAFGESMSSRLFQQLREKEGLCYSVYSFRNYYSDTGLWTIYANCTPPMTMKLIDSLRRELGRVLREPLTAEEIADARSQLKGNLVLSREDMETRMRRLLRQYLFGGRNLEYDESFRLLEAVTEEDVRRVVDRLIATNRFNLLAYGGRRVKGLDSYRFSL